MISQSTFITNSAKSAFPLEIYLSGTTGFIDLAYLLIQEKFPKEVTHLPLEAVTTVTDSHRGTLLVLPFNQY